MSAKSSFYFALPTELRPLCKLIDADVRLPGGDCTTHQAMPERSEPTPAHPHPHCRSWLRPTRTETHDLSPRGDRTTPAKHQLVQPSPACSALPRCDLQTLEISSRQIRELRMMGDLQARRTDNIALLVEAAPVINALQLDQTFDPKLDTQSVQR